MAHRLVGFWTLATGLLSRLASFQEVIETRLDDPTGPVWRPAQRASGFLEPARSMVPCHGSVLETMSKRVPVDRVSSRWLAPSRDSFIAAVHLALRNCHQGIELSDSRCAESLGAIRGPEPARGL